jgi:hypothetical protein
MNFRKFFTPIATTAFEARRPIRRLAPMAAHLPHRLVVGTRVDADALGQIFKTPITAKDWSSFAEPWLKEAKAYSKKARALGRMRKKDIDQQQLARARVLFAECTFWQQRFESQIDRYEPVKRRVVRGAARLRKYVADAHQSVERAVAHLSDVLEQRAPLSKP